MTFAGPHAVGVVLLFARRVERGVIEMRNRDLATRELLHGVQAPSAAKDVERIQHKGPLRVTGARDDVDRRFDRVKLLDKAEEFHGRQSTDAGSEFQEFAVATGSLGWIRPAGWRARNDERRLQFGGEMEPASGVFQNLRPNLLRGLHPVSEVDEGGHGQGMILQGLLDLPDGAAGCQVGVEISVPQFNGSEPGTARGLDLPENRRAANGAGIETVTQEGHPATITSESRRPPPLPPLSNLETGPNLNEVASTARPRLDSPHPTGPICFRMAQPLSVLVTGSSGRIGRAVVAELIRRGHSVRGFDRAPAPDSVDFIQGDLADREAIDRAMRGVERLVHLAATPDDADFLSLLLPNNIIGGYHVMESARAAGVQRIVLASSGQVNWWQQQRGPLPVRPDDLPSPRSWYAATKMFMEAIGRGFSEMYGISVIIARLGWCPRTRAHLEELAATDFGRDVYFSPRDAGRFFACAVEAPLDLRHAVVNAASLPSGSPRFDMASAETLLGYRPMDRWPEGCEGIVDD